MGFNDRVKMKESVKDNWKKDIEYVYKFLI